jgi:hypothetical protein
MMVPPGLSLAVLLGRSDHRAGDAVLDRAARVLVFQLQEQAAKAGVEVPDLNHRGVADQLKRGTRRWEEGRKRIWGRRRRNDFP